MSKPIPPPPVPDGKLFVFSVLRSQTDLVDTVTVIHTNKRDASHAALRQVRRDHNIPNNVGLFAVQKRQEAN